MLDGLIAYASVPFWVSRTWTDDKLSGILGDQLGERDFVIAIDGDGCAFEDEVLVDVPGERVVIVYQDDIGCGGNWRRRVWMAGRVIYELQ